MNVANYTTKRPKRWKVPVDDDYEHVIARDDDEAARLALNQAAEDERSAKKMHVGVPEEISEASTLESFLYLLSKR